MHSRGGLSSRQRRSLAPWRMRPAETWSKSISTTSSGRSPTHSRSLPALQRLGSAEPRSPDSYGARKPDQAALLGGGQPGAVPDDAQLVAVVEAEDQRADRVGLLAGAPADEHGVDRAHALDLEHALALARAVARRALLGDRALGVLEPARGLLGGGDGLHQLDRRGRERRDRRAAPRAPRGAPTGDAPAATRPRARAGRRPRRRRASRRTGARSARRPDGCAGRARRSPRGRPASRTTISPSST